MFTNHTGTVEYPHEGVFYRVGIDDTLPLDQQTETEIEVFSTPYDMTDGGTIGTDTFRIYFPFEADTEELVIAEGNLFRGSIYGASLNGRVIGIYPSQLGGCTVLLKRI